MAEVKAAIGTDPYRIEIVSPTGNMVIADEPLDNGGQDKGFSPKELLASSLAACTCATLRMYANHKGWDVQQINVDIVLVAEKGHTTFNRKIAVTGDLDEAQRARLLGVADSCPLHKILTGAIEINTVLV